MLTDQGGSNLPLMLIPSAIAINAAIPAIESELLSYKPFCGYYCPEKIASPLGRSINNSHTRH
jgi:hypothetical protein